MRRLARALAVASIVWLLGASWNEKPLHFFENGADSANPSSGLTSDAAGNLYGETQGATLPCPESRFAIRGIGARSVCGTIYELSPPSKSNAAWTETILYAFVGHDGICCPHGGLTFDGNGNLYGALSDGESDPGALFELVRSRAGAWKLSIIYRFRGASPGIAPRGALIFDPRGNIYGVTAEGGSGGGGTVFELSPPRKPGQAWRHIALLNFDVHGANGSFPLGGLAIDAAGNLYGTTEFGGTITTFCLSGCGVVYQLVPPKSGKAWTQNVLLSFNGLTDGEGPVDGVVFDAAGALYGTTSGGENGGPAPAGTVFRLAPGVASAPSATWNETVLYGFPQYQNDAAFPASGVRFDAAGNLFGTTEVGGPLGLGTIYRLAPPAAGGASWTESLLHAFGGPNDGVYPVFPVLVTGNALYDATTFGGRNLHCDGIIAGCGLTFSLSR